MSQIRWATDTGAAINVTRGAGWAFRAYSTATPSYPTDTMWHTGATSATYSEVTIMSLSGHSGAYWNSVCWSPNHTWTYGVANASFHGITGCFPIYTESFAQAFGRQTSIYYAGCTVTFVHIVNCTVNDQTREVVIDYTSMHESVIGNHSEKPSHVNYVLPEDTSANFWTFYISDFTDDGALCSVLAPYDDPQIWYQGRVTESDDEDMKIAFCY
nr:MAG: ORF3 protein [Wufeng shrew bastrovirus 1]